MIRWFLFSITISVLVAGHLVTGQPAAAQQPPSFDPSQMQEMMKKFQDPAAMQKLQQQAEAARKCMAEIDDAQIEALRKKTEAASEEIQKLCQAGRKNQALAKGIELSKELRADATIKKLRECSENMSDMLEGMPWARISGLEDLETEKTPTSDDICR